MSKFVAVFPGQGAQFIGMGKSFYDKYSVVKNTYEEASSVLGYDVANMCFNGKISDLNKYVVLFPAIVTTCLAVFRQFKVEHGIVPDCYIGHSLGEYTAMTAAGVLSFEDTLKLVKTRGEIASKATELGTMSIIDNIDLDKLHLICNKVSCDTDMVCISCYNSATQYAICGSANAVMQVEEKALDLEANITPIIGSGPLHSLYMKDYTHELKGILNTIDICEGEYSVISNVTADRIGYITKDQFNENVINHLNQPVKWYQIISMLSRIEDPIFIEMGAKAYLKGLIKDITLNNNVFCYGVKQDRNDISNNKNIQLLKKHACDFVDRVYRIVFTATPNNNPEIDRQKMIGYENEYRAYKKKLQNRSQLCMDDVSGLIKLAANVMKEKCVVDTEQKYQLNKIKNESSILID